MHQAAMAVTPLAVDPELLAAITALLGEREIDGVDRALWDELESLGLARLTGAEDDGGSGASWVEAAALLDVAGSRAVDLPLAENDLLAGWLLRRAGLPADAAMRTAAVVGPDGRATAVPWLGHCDRVVILAEGGVADLSVADVTVSPGFNLAGERRDGLAVDLATLQLTPVPADTATGLHLRGALARAVQACGAMDRVLAFAVEHTTSRQQFGRPLAKFQSVQNLVADIAAEAALARSATEAALLQAVQSDFASPAVPYAVAVARSCVGHAASVVVRNAHQVHGAMGTTREHALHRYTRRILTWRSEFGSVEHWDQVLTDAALRAGAHGADAVWSLVCEGGALAGEIT